MIKEYKDERINELIKKSFERAVKDDEWQIRYLQEWNILFEDIDKMLKYVENGYKGELRVNSNMWYILQDTLVEVLALYDLELVGEEKVSENELVIPTNKIGKIKAEIYKKMIQYGWNLGDNNELEDFDRVYDIHYDFIDRTYDYISEEDYDFSMQDISKGNFEQMIDFMSDFLRALDEVDREMK